MRRPWRTALYRPPRGSGECCVKINSAMSKQDTANIYRRFIGRSVRNSHYILDRGCNRYAVCESCKVCYKS